MCNLILFHFEHVNEKSTFILIRDEIRKIKRADPEQLQQEDSDAVWNELAYFKRENQELMIQK